MELVRITKDNIDCALSIQQGLFPGESARANYEDNLDPASGYEYYMIRDGGTCVGITGIYVCPEDPDSAWLGWFGIIESRRRKGLGTKALRMFEEAAAAGGKRFARIYTDAENNDAAIAFYAANGYTREPYMNPGDPACLKYRTLIFSKSLTPGDFVPWNNRSIHLTEQIAKQEKYA